MTSRRDLLSRFGIGALIAPIIGGVAEESAVAQLIEVPRIKPVELHATIPGPIDMRDVDKVTVLLQLSDGSTRRMESKGYAYGSGIAKQGADLQVNVEFGKNDRYTSPMTFQMQARLSASMVVL